MGLYDDVYAAFEAAGVSYVVVGGTAVASKAHLIEMKQAAGRGQDLIDVEALQELIDGEAEDGR